MFWVLLILLYVLTFPINAFLLQHIWYRRYPPVVYQGIGATVPYRVIAKAQLTAITLFGLLQPALAALPLALGHHWYHWLVCAGAAIAYSSSGSPTSFVDRVRSSHLMFLACLGVFVAVALIVVNVAS